MSDSFQAWCRNCNRAASPYFDSKEEAQIHVEGLSFCEDCGAEFDGHVIEVINVTRAFGVRPKTNQRNKAEKRVQDKHGSPSEWSSGGCHGDGIDLKHRKAGKAAAKEAKRARRRLDRAVVEEERTERDPADVFYAEPGKGDEWLERARKLHAEERWPQALHAWAMVQQYFEGDAQKEAREHGKEAARHVAQAARDEGGPFRGRRVR